MVTDGERREVAARLREQRKKMDAERPPSVPVLAAAEYLLRISHVVLRDEDNGRVFDRLADLIDPTCEAVECGRPDDYVKKETGDGE